MYYYPQNNAGAGYMGVQPVPSGLKGRPVSSLEEARAAQIDFDGSLFIFPDVAHNRIYTKQISMDGTASLNMYELAQLPSTQPIEVNNFITREEFSAAMEKIKAVLNQPTSTEKATESPKFNF